MDQIKASYAKTHNQKTTNTEELNRRLFNTYNRIILRIKGKQLSGKNVDLGCGDKGFSLTCQKKGIESYAFDYPEFDLEKDILPLDNECIDFATMNAVIEHIHQPGHILSEIKRVLKREGLVIIRTPNWKMDFKNFYNDPTHVKPYTPKSLEKTLSLIGFSVIFLEPGLIEKSWFWWKLPKSVKWRIAPLIQGGSKSILAIAENQ